jgi:hypothetical protein
MDAIPIPDSFWSNGLRPDEDIIIRHRSLPYIDESIFSEYITYIFIVYVNSVRENPDLHSEYAVILMDLAIHHVLERIPRVLDEN